MQTAVRDELGRIDPGRASHVENGVIGSHGHIGLGQQRRLVGVSASGHSRKLRGRAGQRRAGLRQDVGVVDRGGELIGRVGVHAGEPTIRQHQDHRAMLVE